MDSFVALSLIFALGAVILILWLNGAFKHNQPSPSPSPNPYPPRPRPPRPNPRPPSPPKPNEDTPVLALFTMPGCGYCVQIKPVFAQVARMLSNRNIIVTTIDSSEQPDLVNLHRVNSFPTLKICNRGIDEPDKCVIYDGQRTVEDIMRFVEQYI